MANDQDQQQNQSLAVMSRQAHDEINKMEQQFVAALQGQIDIKFFIRTTLTAINSNPDLLQADRRSLMEAATKAAQDGLVPDGREGAFSVFKTKVKRNGQDVWIKKVQWMPMVFGIIKKVRNSGELKMLTARVVYGGDRFRYWIDDTGEHIEYEPCDDPDLSVIRKVFAMAITKDGALQIEPMTPAQVEQVRQSSRTKDSGPWVQWWDQMALKTAIRRLSKKLPMSAIDKVLSRDDHLYADTGSVVEGRGFEQVKNPLKDDAAVSKTIEHDADGVVDDAADEADEDADNQGNSGPYDGEGTSIDEGSVEVAIQAAARGALNADHAAARVIDVDGVMTKNDGTDKPAPIIDRRFEEGDTFFNTFDEWIEACTDAEFPTRFSPSTGKPVEEPKRREEPEKQSEQTSSASNQEAKSGTLFPDAGEAAGASKQDAAPQQQAAAKTAPAVSPRPRSAPEDAPYQNAAGYIEYMKAFLADVESLAKLNEEWGSSRTNRNNMLSAEQIQDLNKLKADTVKRIKATGEK